MLRPAMNDMLNNNTQQSYAFVVAVAKRAREIAIESEDKNEILEEKPVALAVTEYDAHPWDIDSEVRER